MKTGAGEVLKSWTAREWVTWRKEVQSVGECMGVVEHCAAQEVAGETPVENVPRMTAEAAQEGVRRAREEGASIDAEEQNVLDLAGEDAGSLPADVGASAFGTVGLASERVTLGARIGNGLEQRFRNAAWNISSIEREVAEKQEVDYVRCSLYDHRAPWVSLYGYHLARGLYLYCTIREGNFDETTLEEKAEKGSPCGGYYFAACYNGDAHIPFGFSISEYTKEEYTEVYGVVTTLVQYAHESPPECHMASYTGTECGPVGIPAPNVITNEIAEANEEEGYSAEPEVKGVALPTRSPSSLNESDLEAISENALGREQIEKLFPSKKVEEQRVEESEGEPLGEGNAGEPGRSGCHVGKPVNCATGDETQSQTDLSVGGRGPALQLALTYNSLPAVKQTTAGPFGFGWTGSYSAHMEARDEGKEVTIYQEDGSTVTFEWNGEKWVAPSALVQATLGEEGSDYVYRLPDQTALYFTYAGQLASETDRNGNTLTIGYNSAKQLETITDSAGRKITFAYNAEGEVESAKDPIGHTVKFTYESGNLASVTLPGEEKPRWKYKYNSEHEMTSQTDGREHTTSIEYNAEHQVASQTDPMSRKRTWKYALTEHGSETTITEPNGSTTVEQFNEYGSPTSVTHASGISIAATSTDEYKGADELLAVTDPNKHKTEYGYDAAGDKTSEKNADGDETKWEYNPTHDVISETTPMGEKTTIEREAHGNPTKISRPAPKEATQVEEYKWSTKGDEESYTDPLKRTWKYEVDSYGDRSAEIDPLGEKRTWGYDEDSFPTSTVSPRGHVKAGEESKYTTKIERDAQERPITITDPLGHTTKIKRDGNGNVETVTDGNNHTTTFGHDADNEQTSAKEANGDTTETEHDAAGQVIAQIDGNKHKTKYERNLLEEITEEIDPLGRKTLKEYDKAGNLEKITDPKKRTTTIKHDPANLVTEISYSDGKTHKVELEYDKDEQRIKMVDGTGTTTIERDQLERPMKITDGHGDSVSYEWDLANENTKLTYPNGKAVERKFDGAGRLEKVIDWLGNTTTFGYDADSDPTSTAFPAATKDEDKTTLNEADQPTKIEMKKGAEVLASLAYTRDDIGQIKTITQKGLPGEEKPAVALDEDNRLTKLGTTEYKYDAANDPTKIGTTTQTFNEGNELEKSGTTSFSFGEAGERTKATPEKGPATTFGFDQAENLISVERPAGEGKAKIEDAYAYNGEGLRASETIAGTTSYLAWDMTEGLPLVLSDATNSYIYGPGDLPIEQINNSTGAVTYLHHDQAGSTRLITGSTGKVEGKCSYSAYGTPTCEGAATTPLGYDGQYTSADTGLIYLRARVYDPATAQFLTVDPEVGTTRAPYNYAGDNPVNRGDATGLSSWNPFSESFWTEGNFISESPLNPIPYYEAEVESYENGCGYFASVAHGLEGAVVGALDASGAGEEGLAAEEGAAGIEAEITGFTRHGLEQALGREGVGVNEGAMLDAVNAPERVINEANGTTRFIGKDATVVLNHEGSVVTTWANNSAGTRIQP